jgi:hypothetical protein
MLTSTKILGFLMVFSLLSGCNDNLKARIDALNAENAALKIEASRLQAENASAQDTYNKLLARNARLKEPAAPVSLTVPAEKMPLSVAWRNGFLIGKVLVLRAESAPFAVTVRHRQAGQFKEKRFIVDNEKTLEVGSAEGFPFASGDELILEADGYKPHYLAAPM